MEKGISQDSEKQDSVEAIPSLIKYVASSEMAGFDSIALGTAGTYYQYQPTATVSATAGSDKSIDETRPINQPGKQQTIFSVSLPTSPIGDGSSHTRRVIFKDSNETVLQNDVMGSSSDVAKASLTPPRGKKFYSQPMPKGRPLEVPGPAASFQLHPSIRNHKLRDHRYDSFKTWSGKLERQITNLRGKSWAEPPPSETGGGQRNEKDALPVARYFDALEGPELETLRPSEELVLPDDKTWPFLLRYPVSSFGICLGVSSQAIMWKTLATAESTQFLDISLNVNLVLWCIAIALVIVVGSIYLLKVIFFFEAVRREYYHPIRVNFFFAPWIALLFLALGVPPSLNKYLHPALWYVLMAPILCLELKIYGQWMSGGQRRLSKVANPSNHLSIVGNFVGALLGASMGLKEGPIFFFAVGLAHYTVLFVTLYQRLPTNETLPKELHPVFFLFVAAPSVASMAWAKIQGSFDYGSRIAYFIALFLYFSLAVRVNFFRGFKFSLAWWAYTFPMTGAAIATIRYANQVTNVVTRALVVILCTASTLTVTALLVTTIVHVFVLRDLFPNDIAIAITERRTKPQRHRRKWFTRISGSPQKSEIENYLKFTSSDSKEDLEAGLQPTSSSENVRQTHEQDFVAATSSLGSSNPTD